jgi:hypothetical protein
MAFDICRPAPAVNCIWPAASGGRENHEKTLYFAMIGH